MNRLFSFHFLLLSIFLVTAGETGIPVTSEILLPEIWIFKKEIKSFDFGIAVRLTAMWGHAVAQFVEALRYKPEGRGFDSRWCHWNFSLT